MIHTAECGRGYQPKVAGIALDAVGGEEGADDALHVLLAGVAHWRPQPRPVPLVSPAHSPQELLHRLVPSPRQRDCLRRNRGYDLYTFLPATSLSSIIVTSYQSVKQLVTHERKAIVCTFHFVDVQLLGNCLDISSKYLLGVACNKIQSK